MKITWLPTVHRCLTYKTLTHIQTHTHTHTHTNTNPPEERNTPHTTHTHPRERAHTHTHIRGRRGRERGREGRICATPGTKDTNRISMLDVPRHRQMPISLP